MAKEVEPIEHYDRMASVVERYLKYGESPAQIGRALDLKRPDVERYLNEWRAYALNDVGARERAKELLAGVDLHFVDLIRRATKTIDDIDTENSARGELSSNLIGNKIRALALVKDLELQRLKAMQEAGLLDDHEAARQRLETELKVEAITNILKDVTADCPRCKIEVAKRISEINNQAVVVND